jgi:WS/DGAT/MGAT family acyltransferase
MSGFMRNSDAFAWHMESDQTLRSTVVIIAWLERAPEWEALVATVERASRMIPGLRERVRVPPLRLATPRWTADERFELTNHLHRHESTAPHTWETVMTIAGAAASQEFDRSRPLWEFTLVEDLEDDRAAFVMKLHHSLTDGVGGVELALFLFDLEANPAHAAVTPDRPVDDRAGGGNLLLLSLKHRRDRVVDRWSSATGSIRPMVRRFARHPFRTVRDAVATLRSIARMMAPVSEKLSPVMRRRGVSRQFEVAEMKLHDLRRAAAAAGGTINDGFLAGVTGGLRRYHERHGSTVDRLRLTLPISIRTPEDPIGGNRLTLIRFAVPVAEVDPASRIRELNRLCRIAQDERSLQHTDGIAAALNLLPRQFVGGMLKHMDFLASNLPGFTFPVYLAAVPVERLVTFGPTTGTSANFTLMSYDGACCIGVNIDTAAVPDADVLIECVREGFEEVLALAGAHDRVRLPLREGPAVPATPTAEVATRPARPLRMVRPWSA